MKDITIERVEAKDASFLSEVALKAYSDHYLHLWHDGGLWYMNKYFTVEQLASELNNQNSRFFIAYFKGAPVGFLKVNINAPLAGFENRNALELERIYLNKEITGKGIGRKLVDLTFKIAQENNKDIVWLKAMDTSSGPISFYSKMGFEINGTHRLKHPLMKEDLRGMVVMIKELTGKKDT